MRPGIAPRLPGYGGGYGAAPAQPTDGDGAAPVQPAGGYGAAPVQPAGGYGGVRLRK